MTEEQKERDKASKRNHYHRNKEKILARQKERKAETREWYINFKSQLKCNRCGEDHIACLEFHHQEPKEKEHLVSHMAGQGWCIETIKKEIEKCEVLCANCHRKEHYRELV